MKTLVIVIHSDMDNSVVNKRWVEELQQYPEKYTIHHLHAQYPDEKIDVKREQQLVEAHDKIIFQFPFYWFNCPPFFKKWLDEVLTYGWAYGSTSGYRMQGKKVALGISAGIREEDYRPSGRYKYTMQQLTAPFEVTFDYVKADYKSFYTYYGVEHKPSSAEIDQSAKEYLQFIDAI
ncbi:NAD(P)H-dependent oxidoreductase [Chitinophaga sp. Mgbs1]|uniref:NAD(P)H-dependent oxidoreductase n=1 Tax=Chitinophaga solisilvae TaxID=1233460 RepID=A0A3S1BH07_9BACT|nr:NAD(P)H-dependent oxidoreductase [Chitinophaga solisilvae]